MACTIYENANAIQIKIKKKDQEKFIGVSQQDFFLSVIKNIKTTE